MRPTRSALAASLAASLLALAAPVAAQPAPPADTAADALALVRGAALTPGRWVYSSTVASGEDRVELGRRTLAVSAATHAGAPAWLVVDATDFAGLRMADTVVVARDDLRPLRRAAAMGPMRLALDFGPAGTRGTMRVAGGGELAVALPGTAGRLVASEAMLHVALRALPLGAGWRGRVTQLVLTPAGVATAPLELAVVGEETVELPSGPRAAWVLSASTEGGEQRLWVAKEGGVLLRQRSSPPHAPGFVYVTTLVESPPAGG